MRVIVGNVKCNPKMRQSYVNDDITHLGRMGNRRKDVLVFGSEIEISRYRAAWARILRGFKLVTHNNLHESPISLCPDYLTVLSSYSRKTHNGRKFVTPTRYIEVLLTQRAFPGGKPNVKGNKIAFIATHFVSGAWSNKHKLTKKWRQKMWNIHYAMLKQIIADLVAQGYTVIVGGDWNRVAGGIKALHPHQVTLVSHGLDHLYGIPAKGKHLKLLRTEQTHVHEVHTDHPMIAADFHILDAA